MNKFTSYIIYKIIKLISLLPFGVLYFISDILYLIIYHIVGYRKEVVYKNLKSFFPNKTDKERIKIQKKFYLHFTDLFVEVIKSFTLSPKQFKRRLRVNNIELLNNLYDQQKSVIIMGSHYGNWEWALNICLYAKHKTYVAYSRIRNKYLEQKIKENRSRFGANLILRQHIIKKIITNIKSDIPSIYVLLSDQSPQINRTFYWSNFLGKRVPIINGAEVLAKKFDLAIVYMHINKIKRGNYECHLETLTQTPKDYQDFHITELYLKKLQNNIAKNPPYYLWTHNRLKHAGKEHYK